MAKTFPNLVAHPYTVVLDVNVTAADIRAGERGTIDTCPVSRAVRRAMTLDDQFAGVEALTDLDTLTLVHERDPKGKHAVDIPLAPEIVLFLRRFDAGLFVLPIRFALMVNPSHFRRLSYVGL